MQSRALAAARRPPAVSRGSHSSLAFRKPLIVAGAARSLAAAPKATPTSPPASRPRAAVAVTAAAAVAEAAAPPTADPAALLAAASQPPPSGKLRAVVYGGGLAGLAAARVLAESFDEVFLFERDPLPPSPSDGASASSSPSSSPDPAAAAAHARRGVPQYRQPHQLLARGLLEIEKLFPGVTEDLFKAGAAEVAVPGGYSVFDDRVGHLKHTHASVTLVGSTRALLESVVRARLTRGLEPGEAVGSGAGCRAKVRVVPGAVVTGWLLEKESKNENDEGKEAPARVVGVRVRPASGSGTSSSSESATFEVRADLVVDASGRGSKAPEWLSGAGFQPPETTTVSAGTVYLTATYRVPPEALPAPLNPAPGNAAADPAAIAAFEEGKKKQKAAAAAAASSSSSSASERLPGYGIMCYTSFPRTRSSILMPVENGLHQLICCAKMEDLPKVEGAAAGGEGGGHGGGGHGHGHDNAVATDAGVLAFCDSLPDGGQTARALRAAERVGDITTYRRTENFRRRYEKLVEGGAGRAGGAAGGALGAAAAAAAATATGVPLGWVALGDAAVAFNPVFGQGISVGVLQALKLGELVKSALAKGGNDTPPAARSAAVASVGTPFFSALPSVVEVPWALAAGTDAPFAAPAGFQQSAGEKMINAYFDGVLKLAAEDPKAYDSLIATVHMTKPTESLLHPSLALRVAARGVVGLAKRALGLGKAVEGGGEGAVASGSASAR